MSAMSAKRKLAAGLCAAAAVAVIGGLAVSLVMNFRMNSTLKEVRKLTSALSSQAEDPEQDGENKENSENGEVVIGDEYVIRDYSRIAEAYLSKDSSALTDDTDKEILQLASDLLDEIISEDMSDYEKELAVHDWLAENVSFDGDSLLAIPAASRYADSPYGALKYKNAVCVGYATTFELLMEMLGMDCQVIHDKEFSHSWDVVKLDDGEYYLVDVTFDSQGNGSFTHQNFNLNEDAFAASHDWEINDYPRAFGTKYNYAVMNCKEVEDIYHLPEAVDEAIKAHQTEFFFSVKDQNDPDGVYTVAAVVDMISQRCMENSDIYIELSPAATDGKNVFSLSIDHSDDDGDGMEVPDDLDEDKLVGIVDELFGELYEDY